MSTQFDTGFSDANNDIIEAEHVKQFADPINELESGAALFRVASNDSGAYSVDFTTAANPNGHSINSLSQGQVIVFKASHNSPANATLKVLRNDSPGSETHPLFLGDAQAGDGDILADQMVIVVFNNTTTPRFDVVGISSGGGSLAELDDVMLTGTPAPGQILRYNGSEFTNETMVISDVSGLQDALEDKQNVLTDIDGVPGLNTALDDIQTQLDAKGGGAPSSTDNAISRFDGTTGKSLQNSLVKIDDSGRMVLPLVIGTGGGLGELELYGSTAGAGGQGLYQFGRRHVYTHCSTKEPIPHALQPLLSQLRRSTFEPNGNGTVVSSMGFPVSTVGTATTRNVASTNMVTRARRLGYVSASSAGSVAGLYQTTAQYTASRLYLVCHFAISDASLVSGARMFVGLTSSTSAPTNVSPDSLANCIGIAQLSTDSTKFYAVQGTGTTSSFPLSSTIAPALGKIYRLEIYSYQSNGAYEMVLTDLSTGTIASDSYIGAPGTSTFVGFRAWRSNNTTASAVGIDIIDICTEAYYK
jgi:hypothetical protein